MLEVCISPSLTMYLGHSRRALSRSQVKSAVLCVFGELLLGCSALDIILNFEWYLLSKNYKKRFRHFCNVLMHCEWTSSLLAEREKNFHSSPNYDMKKSCTAILKIFRVLLEWEERHAVLTRLEEASFLSSHFICYFYTADDESPFALAVELISFERGKITSTMIKNCSSLDSWSRFRKISSRLHILETSELMTVTQPTTKME